MNKLGFKLILAGFDKALYDEFVKAFEGFPEVECYNGRFEDTDFDCVVSAANSFGLMDGGVDQCITDYFGKELMYSVQNKIIEDFAGEQPVGTSFVINGLTFKKHMQNPRVRYVAHTPTMRIPKSVSGSDNAYRAMKAALLAVKAHNKKYDSGSLNQEGIKSVNGVDIEMNPRINTLVCPGLATLTGRIPYDKAAHQMALATFHVMNPPKMINWYYASQRDAEIEESR